MSSSEKALMLEKASNASEIVHTLFLNFFGNKSNQEKNQEQHAYIMEQMKVIQAEMEDERAQAQEQQDLDAQRNPGENKEPPCKKTKI